MHFRTLLSGTLAVFLMSGGMTFAQDNGGLFGNLPKVGLPGVFGGGKQDNAQMAQAGDPRVTTLEEQIRQLNGRIEELNFQILQMQDQLRKQQEDNEFRFQELEKKSGAVRKSTDPAVVQANPPAVEPPPEGTAATAEAQPAEPQGEVIIDPRDGEPGKVVGEPPKEFGSITFDKNGNVTGGTVGNDTPAAPALPGVEVAQPPRTGGEVVAALPSTNDPEELYRNSYEFILSGDYSTAEAGFRDHIDRFPGAAKTADAHFWLGESLLGQQKYRDAAEVFLAANKSYPKSKKAPDMLLKLGISLAGLKQNDVACATFAEVGKRYPNISGALKERVKQEQALAAC